MLYVLSSPREVVPVSPYCLNVHFYFNEIIHIFLQDTTARQYTEDENVARHATAFLLSTKEKHYLSEVCFMLTEDFRKMTLVLLLTPA